MEGLIFGILRYFTDMPRKINKQIIIIKREDFS